MYSDAGKNIPKKIQFFIIWSITLKRKMYIESNIEVRFRNEVGCCKFRSQIHTQAES
jgi:hypothetical protein